MTLKLAPASSHDLDSSCSSIDKTSDGATSSSEILRIPFSRGRREVYDEDGTWVAELPPNDLQQFRNANINIDGGSKDIVIGNPTHFHKGVTIIVHPPKIPETQNGGVPRIDEPIICEKEVHVIPPPPAAPPDLKPRPGFFRRHFKAIMITLTAATLILATTLIALRLVASKKSRYTPPEPTITTTEEPITTTRHPIMPSIIKKETWGGRTVSDLYPIEDPIRYVIIKHTKTKTCIDTNECYVAMQNLQQYDVEEYKLKDIRYNFVIGGDANIYVGRGWHFQNEQSEDSIDVAYMGDYSVDIPSDFLAAAGNYLVVRGISLGVLSYSDIKVICHNQTEDVDSPGEYLYRKVVKWDHYSPEIIKNVSESTTTEEPTVTTTEVHPVTPQVISKAQWGGRTGSDVYPIDDPIRYVIIKHTKTKSCMNRDECYVAMRNLQQSDIEEHKLKDIRYNFVIGGDGNIYVGRGWQFQNEQSEDSIDVAYMGDYSVDVPSKLVADAGNFLVSQGITSRFLNDGYTKVICHNQTEDVDSPGEYLYREIVKWERYSPEVIKNMI